MRIGEPVVQRHEPDLGAVAHEQENKRERKNRWLELALDTVELGPQERAAFHAEYFLRGEVEKDRSEERLRDAHAAEDEIFPRRLQARWRAVERYEEHGGERGRLKRDPEDPHVVGEKREQHREIEQLIHAVIEPEPADGHAAVRVLDAHVGLRKDRRRE